MLPQPPLATLKTLASICIILVMFIHLPPVVTIPVDGKETIDPEDNQTTDVAEATTPTVTDDPTATTPGEVIIITIPIDQTPVPTPDTGDTVTVPSDGEFTPEPTPEETPDFTPEPTPEETPDFTPEPTPEIIPDFTPEPAPEPNPEPTPGSTPVPAPEAVPELACNSDLDQCYNTMEIYCNYIVIGTPGIFGVFTAQECFERCYNDPTCLLWTHIGTSCYVSSDPANNFVEDSWEGWTSGIRGRC
ncbi:hypothetical protein CC79DRAFT_1355946 [Sarocladium strictum]